MSDLYTPSDLHMSWCDGTHRNEDGACLLQVGVDDGDGSALLSLTGIHCDSQRLRLAGDVTTVEGLAQLVQALLELDVPLLNGLNDITCVAHLDRHDDTDDDGDY